MTDFLAAYAHVLVPLVKVAVLLFIVLTAVAYITWLERKVVAHIQGRWGPYRVGPHGLLQPLADGLKFLLKEDPTPLGVDRFVYFFAPFLALALALSALAVIPFGPEPIRIGDFHTPLSIAEIDISLLFLFAITALSVYGVVLAGWASNSKYPLLGGLRSSAQMVSYELALMLSVVGVLLVAGTFNLREIITAQQGHYWGFLPKWFLFAGPLPQIIGFVCFFIAAIAETNRVPFDLPEAETELVAGFHTEYSSLKFAMFFMAEYVAMITASCLVAILFFGGWLSPFPPSVYAVSKFLPALALAGLGLFLVIDGLRYRTLAGKIALPVLGLALIAAGAACAHPSIIDWVQGPFWFLAKVFFFLFFYIWMRGTLPRFRYDQLMDFGWKVLFPLAMLNVILTSLALVWPELREAVRR
ncbi:MAG: complex I subunit 1/NuoH family protein [Candidatus Acidiferrales bacterium]